jgi:hypothetical protein
MDRKDSYTLDLGVDCMPKHWQQYQEDDFMNAFISSLTLGFDKVLKNLPKYNGHVASCNNQPYLNGDWGDVDVATMTE